MEFKNGIPQIEEIMKEDYFRLSISREEVKNYDYSRIEKLLEVMKPLKEKARGRIEFYFADYEDDERKVYKISEIRKYVKGLVVAFPNVFYFINTESGCAATLICCMLGIQSIGQKSRRAVVGITPNKELFQKIENACTEYVRFFDDKYFPEVEEMLGVAGLKINQNFYKRTLVTDPEGSRFKHIAKNLYKATSEKKKFDIISIKDIEPFLKENRTRIYTAVYSRETLICASNKHAYNVFAVADTEHNCDICGSTEALIYKPNLEVVDFDNIVWVPTLEHYKSRKVVVGGVKFQKQLPVPVNIETDKWVCPKCGRVGNFVKDEEGALKF